MRLLFLNPCARMGGAETSLLELLSSIRATRPDWPIHLWLGEDGPFTSKVRSLGVAVTVATMPEALTSLGDAGLGGVLGKVSLAARMAASTPVAIAYCQALKRFIKSWQPAVVHTTGFKMHLLGAMACPSNTKLVWHMHDYLRGRVVMKELLRTQHAKCRALLVNSQSVALDYSELCSRGQTPKVIYNAIDCDRFSPNGPHAELDRLAGLDPCGDGVLRIGLLATFAKWKGHATFLEAIALLPKDLPFRAYIIGEAIYQRSSSQFTRNELELLAADTGVVDRIGFTGFIDDVPAAMRSLDVIVHASTDPEPFGMVIAEGMACERAVVASRAGGALEIIDEGQTALAHNPGDAKELSACLERLITDQGLRRRLAIEARKAVLQKFGRERLGQQLAELYEEFGNGASGK
jgi:glycosyltransferase involved in cell wall biosynthesis